MKKGLVGGLSLGVASATALNFDHPTSGSPFKGHKNVVQEGRLPLGDLSNRDSGKGINEHMQSTWDFHKVSKSKAGELGMETFKKFLEKKKGVVSSKPSRGTAAQRPADPAANLPPAVGSPEHRAAVQTAESAKSPWSYQLQVPLWPLNMTLALSVQEEEELRKERALREQNRRERAYLEETVFNNAGNGAAMVAPTAVRAKVFDPLPESKFAGSGAGGLRSSAAKPKPKPRREASAKVAAKEEQEEEFKLPTPTLLANRRKEEDAADAAADVQAVALFPVEQEVAVAVEVAQAPAPQEPEKAAEEMSVAVETPAEAGPAADAEESIEEIDRWIEEEVAAVPAAAEDAVAEAPEPVEVAPVRSKPPPPPPRRPSAAAAVEPAANASDEAASPLVFKHVTFVNPLVSRFMATPKRTVEEGEGEGEGKEDAAARTIAAAFRRLRCGRLMHSMAGLRRDLGKLASLSGSVEPLDSIGGSFVGEYDEIVEAVTGNGGISMASDLAARAASLHSRMECAIQALVDSSEKTKKYQIAYRKRRLLEQAAVVVQRSWRARRVLRRCRAQCAAVVLQSAWRACREARKSERRTQGKAQQLPTPKNLAREISSAQRSRSATPTSLTVTPVSNWADAVEQESREKKLRALQQESVEKSSTSVENSSSSSAADQQSALRDELASLRKELELLRSEVAQSGDMRRGRSATRQRGKGKGAPRSFSAAGARPKSGGGEGGNRDGGAAGSGDQPQRQRKSRSLSRSRRRRRNSSAPPPEHKPRQQQQQQGKQRRDRSKGRPEGQKENRAPRQGGERREEEPVMMCAPPGLSAPPGLARGVQAIKKASDKKLSHLAKAFYSSKSRRV